MASYSARCTFPSLPKTTRGKPLVLGGDPKGKNFLYTNGHNVIIRNIENPYIADIYTQHSCPTTVAKYSPSGFYICSGDESGKVRIWDTTQQEHILKKEFHCLGGAIRDIQWSPDNQRIVVAGDGKESFARVFMWDSGNSVGEFIGHSASINSCDYKSTRPFKIVTASEDKCIGFFEGPPFKFKQTLQDHTNFVNAVRFSPDGNVFISGGADGRAFIYDAKNAEKVGELGPPAHKGGIYGLEFSPDSQHCLTVSGDKTAKMWDVSTQQVVTEFPFGKSVEDMQLGCLWQGQHMLTVSLSGYINYLDKNNPTQPHRILKGHNKPMTAMTVTEDRSTLFTGSSDSHINYWDSMSGNDGEMAGKGHGSQVQKMTVMGDTLISIGLDDTVIFSSARERTYGSHVVKVDSQPKDVAAKHGQIVIACVNHILVFEGERKVTTLNVTYEPVSVSIHPDGREIAVGGAQDNKIHIYQLSGMTLSETRVLEQAGTSLALEYSPNGTFLGSAGSDRRVRCYQLPSYETIFDDPTHTARVNCLAWTPNSAYLASGSLDNNLIVWKPIKSYDNKLQIKGAHPMAQITDVVWISDNILVSTAQDSTVKQWNIS
ncbi:hypothetical protein ScPMuIL_006509 [Solemya velum]